ncbi:adenylosuccinate lyase, putative [Babesia caballi]|uniref:Adenylosuccinate lyase, putative n=1 Tax=Babesia caballi TaxID=5871 RepID=A0AAV4LN52_BABCB|nr:adenylosuccinate lyase, putative [Babesia caballi]
MTAQNKLSTLLDEADASPVAESDNTPTSAIDSEAVMLMARLDRVDLARVVAAMGAHVNVEEVIRTTVPDVLEKRTTAAGADQEELTGINLLDAEEAQAPTDVDIPVDGESQDCPEYFLHIAKFAPLRLTLSERKLMRLLDSTLHVSEYTDKIDIIHEGNKTRKIVREIKEVCAILSGLAVAHNYDDGQRLVRDRDYAENAEFFRNVFEVGRRYKILNPDKIRNSYGKLMYFLMDSRKPEIQELLNFDCVAPVKTVFSLLASKKRGLDMLQDPKVRVATMEITPEGKSRGEVQREIAAKEEAVRYLVNKYARRKTGGIMGIEFSFLTRPFSGANGATDEDEMTPEEVQTCLYSLSDHNSHLRAFRRPCDLMIAYLKENFNPSDSNPKYNLSISAGSEGARLSHGHARQFTYVLQSLTLWREIAHDMFALWHYAEADLLDADNPYRLRNTGQGLNRVQDGLHVVSGMRKILHRVQQKVGSWVGSNMVHLGDHNVPNSFMFIDKYTQIPRILSPIVSCIEKIPELYRSTSAMRAYIDTQFGGPKHLKMQILTDFFRHAFDGSGADNFNDAGSCIDGRLTSAWNWCSKIEKKKYFPVFLLTSFSGFDGRFGEG